MPYTDIETLYLADGGWYRNEFKYPNLTFNSTVLVAVTTIAPDNQANYFISLDSTSSDATTEIEEAMFNTFVNGDVVNPTVVRVHVGSIKEFIMKTSLCDSRETLEIDLL